MSKTAEKPETKAPTFEQIFGTLEQRVEGLSGRIRELVAENARLKKQLQEQQGASEAQAKSAEKLAKLEAEREEVRARIERLLTGLEKAEAGT